MTEANYFQKVYYVTSQVPFGRVTTYGAIADYLALGSARMVGWALNNCNLEGYVIPAHRVINRKGELTGKNNFPTPTIMQELLENEGIEVENDRVIEFDELFWHPGENLPSIDDIETFELPYV